MVKVDWKTLSAALSSPMPAQSRRRPRDNEVLFGEATSLSGWMAAFDTSPTGSAEVARDDIEAGMKGRFKVAQFRAESDGDESS